MIVEIEQIIPKIQITGFTIANGQTILSLRCHCGDSNAAAMDCVAVRCGCCGSRTTMKEMLEFWHKQDNPCVDLNRPLPPLF